MFLLTFFRQKWMLPVLSALYLLAVPGFAKAGQDSSISNNSRGLVLLLPYQSGVDYGSYDLFPGNTIQSKLPSAPVRFSSLGTAGQFNSFALDGGPASYSKTAVDGLVLESGQFNPISFTLFPIEFAEKVTIYKNNLEPLGIEAPSGLADYHLPEPGASNYIGLDGDSSPGLCLKGLFGGKAGGTALLFGVSYSFSSNQFTYIDRAGKTNPSVNLDFTRYSAFFKMLEGPSRLNITHTGNLAGAPEAMGAKPRLDDWFSTADYIYQSGDNRYQLSYINWYEHSYGGVTGGSHLNQTVKANAEQWMTYNNYRSCIRLQDISYFMNSSSIGDRNNHVLGLISENYYHFSSFNFGLNFNNTYDVKFGYQFLPAVVLEFHWMDELRLSASISRKCRTPDFNDLYYPMNSSYSGNPSLTPEEGWYWKTGILLDLSPVQFSASYSESYLSNLILWMPGNSGALSPSNCLKTTGRMADAELDYSGELFGVKFKTTVSLGFDDTFNDDPHSIHYQKMTVYTPLYQLTGAISASYKEDFIFTFFLRRVSERFTREDNSDSLPPYLLVNAGLQIFWFSFNVENILNEQFQEQDGYSQPGRVFHGGIQYYF